MTRPEGLQKKDSGKKTTRPYGYLEPQNPLIPLKPSEPAIKFDSPVVKFDHPVPKRGLDRHPGPIVPNPSLSQNIRGGKLTFVYSSEVLLYPSRECNTCYYSFDKEVLRGHKKLQLKNTFGIMA